MGEDVAKGADILSLCEQQLLQDTLQPPARGTQPVSAELKHTQEKKKLFIVIENIRLGSKLPLLRDCVFK